MTKAMLLMLAAATAVVRAQTIVNIDGVPRTADPFFADLTSECRLFDYVDDVDNVLNSAVAEIEFDIRTGVPLTNVIFVAAAAHAEADGGEIVVSSFNGNLFGANETTEVARVALGTFAAGDAVNLNVLNEVAIDQIMPRGGNRFQAIRIEVFDGASPPAALPLLKATAASVLGGICQDEGDAYVRATVSMTATEGPNGDLVLFNGALCYLVDEATAGVTEPPQPEPEQPEPEPTDLPIDLEPRVLEQGELPTELAVIGVGLSGLEFGLGFRSSDPTFVEDNDLFGYANLNHPLLDTNEIDYYISKGMNAFRISFKWERLQPVLGEPLDECHFARINHIVEYITDRGLIALLDMHQRPGHLGRLITGDEGGVSIEEHTDFWERIAAVYASNTLVWYNPLDSVVPLVQGLSTFGTVEVLQPTIDAVRAAGATAPFVVQGPLELMALINDPLNKIYIANGLSEINADTCLSGAISDLPGSPADLVTLAERAVWLRENNRKGFIKSLGVARTTECYERFDEFLAFLNDNADVFVGITAWVGGPWWGDYEYTLNPRNGEIDRPQMDILERWMPPIGQLETVNRCDTYTEEDASATTRGATAVIFDIVAEEELTVDSIEITAAVAHNEADGGSITVTYLGGSVFLPDDEQQRTVLVEGFTLPTVAAGETIDVTLSTPLVIDNGLGRGIVIEVVGSTDAIITVTDGAILGGVCQAVGDLYARPDDNGLLAFIAGEDQDGDVVLFNGAICWSSEQRVAVGEVEGAAVVEEPEPTVDLAPASDDQSQLRSMGVNLAGMQFGLPSVGNPEEDNFPGYQGLEYHLYTREEIDYYLEKGMNIFRINFRWERIQYSPSGDLDECAFARLNDIVQYITDNDAVAMLDMHQRAFYEGEAIWEDGSDVTVDDFADYWGRMAEAYSGNDLVWYNLLDQARDIILGGVSVDIYNAAIGAIRAANATTPIVVRTTEADALNLVDPLNMTWIGTASAETREAGGGCTTIGATTGSDYDLLPLRNKTVWLRENGWTGFVLSLGIERTAACYEGLDELLTYLSDNADVWHGITYWSGGPAWGGYPYSISPTTDEVSGAFVDRQQMDVFERHLPPLGLDATPDVGGPDGNSTEGPGGTTPPAESSAFAASATLLSVVVGAMVTVSALLL